MNNPQENDAANIRVPPPLYPLATILVGVGLNWLWPFDPGFEIPAPARYWLGGIVVAASMLGFGLWPVLIMRRSGQSELPWKPTPSILTDGPYRVTRNPMYLQMVLVCIGVAIILMNAWIVLLTPLCAWVLYKFAIAPEEAYLEGKFGEIYLSYKRQVRRWI